MTTISDGKMLISRAEHHGRKSLQSDQPAA